MIQYDKLSKIFVIKTMPLDKKCFSTYMSHKSAVGFVCSKWTRIRSGSSSRFMLGLSVLGLSSGQCLVNGLNLGVSVVRIV